MIQWDSKRPSLIVFGVITGMIMAFFAGYTMGKYETQIDELTVAKMDLSEIVKPIQTSSTKLENAIQKIEEAIVRLETVSKNQLNQVNISPPADTVKPKIGRREKITSETIQKGPVSPQTTTSTCDPANVAGPEAWNKFLVSLGLVNYNDLENSVEKMFSTEDNFERQQIVKSLARITSPEVKAQIVNLILDENDDVDVRRTAIESLDWKGNADMLATIFQTAQNNEVRESTIYAAKSTRFDDSDRAKIDQTLLQTFPQETEDLIKMAIIDYFADVQPGQVDQLLSSVPSNSFSTEVLEHIEVVRRELLPQHQ